jgi:serine/threonine protein kinase SCH9
MGSSINDAKEIKSHPFYQTINWEALCSKQIVPQFIPNVKSVSDVVNIDPSFLHEASKETPVHGDINGNTFKGFTYNEEAIRIGEELSTQNNLLNIKT